MRSFGTAGGMSESRRAFLRRTGGALALAAATLVGCAPPPTPSPRVRLLGAVHPVGAVQKLIEEHLGAAAGEAKVQLDFTPLAPNDLRAKLPVSAAAGQSPDLALVGEPDVVEQAGLERTRDLRGTLDQVTGLNGELLPPLRELVASGPFLDRPSWQPAPAYGIPYYTYGCVLLVRSDLVGSALPIPAPGTSLSFDDLRGAVVKLTDAGANRFGWGAALPIGDLTDQIGQVAFRAAGAALFDDIGYRVVLNASDAQNALAAISRLYRGDAGDALAPAGVLDWSVADQVAAFRSGRVLQTLDLGGLYPALTDPSLRQATLALPLPAGPKGWNAGATSTHFVVFATSRVADAAGRLVQRVLQPARYDALIRLGQGSFIPPYAYATKGPFWDSDPNLPVYVGATRGDPAHNYGLVGLGTPAPSTLAVARVRGAWLLANALRQLIQQPDNAPAIASDLIDRATALAQVAPLLQPTPTPVALPPWFNGL